MSQLNQASEIDGDVLLLITPEDVTQRLKIEGIDAKLMIDLLKTLQNPSTRSEVTVLQNDSEETEKKSKFFKRKKKAKVEDLIAQSILTPGGQGKGCTFT